MLNINKLRELSKQRGVSMAHLSRLIGRDRSYFFTISGRGGSLSQQELTTIAEALQTSVEYLTDETDDPSAPPTIANRGEREMGASERAATVGNIVELLGDLSEDKLDAILHIVIALADK